MFGMENDGNRHTSHINTHSAQESIWKYSTYVRNVRLNEFTRSLASLNFHCIQWIWVFASSFVPPLYMNISSLKDKLYIEFTALTIIWHTKTFRNVFLSLFLFLLYPVHTSSPSLSFDQSHKIVARYLYIIAYDCDVYTSTVLHDIKWIYIETSSSLWHNDGPWMKTGVFVIFILKMYSPSLLIHLFFQSIFTRWTNMHNKMSVFYTVIEVNLKRRKKMHYIQKNEDKKMYSTTISILFASKIIVFQNFKGVNIRCYGCLCSGLWIVIKNWKIIFRTNINSNCAHRA